MDFLTELRSVWNFAGIRQDVPDADAASVLCREIAESGMQAILLVAGFHQHCQQVILLGGNSPPPVEDGIHLFVDGTYGGPGAPVARRGHAQRRVERQLETECNFFDDGGDGIRQALFPARKAAAEQGAGDHPHGQGRGFIRHVDHLTGSRQVGT